MFAVANSECRYPKGSELAPWNYVQIAGEVPILLVSGSGSSRDIREAHEAGISAFLEKPFTVSSLRDQVRAHVETIPVAGCPSDGAGARPSLSRLES